MIKGVLGWKSERLLAVWEFQTQQKEKKQSVTTVDYVWAWVHGSLQSRVYCLNTPFQPCWQILWCGELIPMLQRTVHGARELMPPRVATKYWLKVLVNKYSSSCAPQARQLEGVTSELQEAPSGIKLQVPRENQFINTPWITIFLPCCMSFIGLL